MEAAQEVQNLLQGVVFSANRISNDRAKFVRAVSASPEMFNQLKQLVDQLDTLTDSVAREEP